jgi:hypothetical protein
MSFSQIQPRYTVTLADVQQLAQLVSLADDLKNYVPPECEIASEAAIAVNRAHNLLQRVLGEDVARIYPDEEAQS